MAATDLDTKLDYAAGAGAITAVIIFAADSIIAWMAVSQATFATWVLAFFGSTVVAAPVAMKVVERFVAEQDLYTDNEYIAVIIVSTFIHAGARVYLVGNQTVVDFLGGPGFAFRAGIVAAVAVSVVITVYVVDQVL